MTTKQNKGTIILGLLLLFALWQKSTTISVQQYSIMDVILPSGTGIEKMVLWWLGIAVISALVIHSFWWKK